MTDSRWRWVALLAALPLVLSLGVAWAVLRDRGWDVRGERYWASRECNASLKAFFVAEKSYFEEQGEFREDFRAVGFVPQRGNHFLYVVSRAGPIEDRSGPLLSTTGAVGIIGVDEYAHPGASTSALLAKLPTKAEGGVDVGVSGTCPPCEVVAMCVANLDDDDAVEVWSLATFDRSLADGGLIQAGVPNQDQSDLF